MSNFYVLKDIISLSNYSKKYGVNLKKIYRYIADELVEHYWVDNVPYLPDHEIPHLIHNHKRNEVINNVQSLTSKLVSVKTLTLKEEVVDNEEVNDVKILTLEQKEILTTPDVKLNGENLDKKYKILNLIEEIKKI
jgi:hypothetical protein